MTKRRLWLVVGSVLLVVAGWFGYGWINRSGRAIESLIMPDALLVLESVHLQDTVSTRTTRREMTLQQAPVFAEAVQRFNRFAFAPADTATVLRFLAGKPVRYSLHSVSKNRLDFVFYVPINHAADKAYLQRLQNPDPKEYRVLSHLFEGERVLQLVNLRNDSYGSFIVLDDYLIGSPSGILMENMVSHLKNPLRRAKTSGLTFDRRNHLAGLSLRPDVLQALFGDADATGSLVRLFLPEELNLQFRQSVSHDHLIGYATDRIGERRDVAALFAGQTPTRMASADLIPQTTATLYHIGPSDARLFGQRMTRLLQSSSNDALRDRWNRIEDVANGVYEAVRQDIILCRLESADAQPRQLLLLQATDVKRLSEAYQRVAYQAGASARVTPKTFLGHKILPLAVAELPATLFSSLFTGFRQSWITQHNGYLIVANSEDVMQDYLLQLQRQAVWAADERQANLLKQTLRPANFTAFVRVNRAPLGQTDANQTLTGTPANLPAYWPAAWRNLLSGSSGTTSPSMANLENMVYQASYGNQKILSTLVLGRTTRRASAAVLNRLLLQKKVEFNAPLMAAPVIAGNLSNGSAQIWAQNNVNQFVLVTAEGDKIVQDTTDGPIRSNALAVDFLNNGRLQYLFMTDRSLYVADLRNRTVQLRSLRLPPNTETSLLMLPRSSRQRSLVALVTTRDGAIYALDKDKRNFVRLFKAARNEPLLLPYQVLAGPEGMEIIALQAGGTLNRWREAGGPALRDAATAQAPRFPVKFNGPFAGPALQPSSGDGIRLISESGELIRLNDQGLIADRTQLYRPIRSGSFRLFPDVAQTNWLLLRTSDTEVAVLDQQGNERFEIRGLRGGLDNVRYHRLGSGIELISVKSGRFTTLFDLNGRVVGDRPIPGDFPVALQFDEVTNELHIVSGVAKAVQLFTIRLR